MSDNSNQIDRGLRDRLLEALDDKRSVADLRTYFGSPDDATSGFTGRWFDPPADRNAEPSPDRFTADDVVAVSMLSVQIPAIVIVRLLYSDDAKTLNAWLTQVDAETDLWDADMSMIDDDSPANQVWQAIRNMGWHGGDEGGAWVTAGKLLARKRPRLIPIYDSRVQKVASLAHGASWWYSLRAALDADVVGRIRQVGQEAELPEHVSVLRILDVVIWMRGER